MGSYAVTRFVAFLSIVYMARVLGSEDFGQINFAQAILVYATLLTNLGLMSVGTRDVAQTPDRVTYITSNFLALRLVLALGSYVLLALAVFLMPIPSQGKALILLFGLTVFPTAATLDWVFKGLERMGVVASIEVFRTVPFLLFVVLSVRAPREVYRVATAYFVGTFITAVFSLVMYSRNVGQLRLAADFSFWKLSMKTAWPLGLAFIMVQIYYLTDTVMLAFLKGNTAVGWYSASYKIIAFIQGVGGWYFEAIFPLISRLFRDSITGLRKLLEGSAELTTAIVTPVAVGGVILAQPILLTFYGKEYGTGALAFQILVCAIAVELVGMLFGYSLMACARLKQYLTAVTVGAVTSVVMNVILIPRFGLAGAGVARLMSEALIALCFILQFQSVLHIPLAKHFAKPAVAAVVMALVLAFVQTYWVLRMLVGCVVYFGAYVALSSLQKTPWYAPLKQISADNSVRSDAVEHSSGMPTMPATAEHEAF
jgi:O-antigen/teichoic acid export membrane protein